MIEPLQVTVDLSCDPAHAFSTWTSRIDTWWPADHTVSGDPDATITLEPGVGGRLLERTRDGVEHVWGEVTTWDPPSRLGYRWHLGRTSDQATDVEVRFVAGESDTTHVEIRHTGWEALGDDAQVWRDRNHQGWSTLLPHLAAAVEGGE
jgi:uncharacterized protein YndB with AHSA1/START domain